MEFPLYVGNRNRCVRCACDRPKAGFVIRGWIIARVVSNEKN